MVSTVPALRIDQEIGGGHASLPRRMRRLVRDIIFFSTESISEIEQ